MIRKGLPWMVVVLGTSASASAQMTVGEEQPGPHGPQSAIRSAAREHRSISIDQDTPESGPTVETPEFHTVERGDTLWDITGSYFQNPWRWPRVWGLNPQITNPHWIFPGDQVRLLPPNEQIGRAHV
jgi:nucleoid-associated protein YgaU